MPPVTREMVSLPDKSVTWTKVSLNLVDQCWTLGSTVFPGCHSHNVVFSPPPVIPTTWCPAQRALSWPQPLQSTAWSRPLSTSRWTPRIIAKLTRQRCEQRQRRAHPRQRWGRERQLPAEGHELSWEPGTVSTFDSSSLSDISAIRRSPSRTLPKCPTTSRCTARPNSSARLEILPDPTQHYRLPFPDGALRPVLARCITPPSPILQLC